MAESLSCSACDTVASGDQAGNSGRTYPEAEVDAVLTGFYPGYPDYAALRRYLVDDAFLTREANVYWRSGGTFAV